MLRVDEPETSKFPLLARGVLERASSLQRLDAGPSVPLIARDSFVAETATKIEQVQASVRLLTREVGELSAKVAALQDAAAQDDRWYAFQQGERRAREKKLDETLRCCRDLKARLDRVEARSGGNYHVYNSLDAVSRKLSELEHFKDEAQRIERTITMRAWLFCGALALAAAIMLASNIVSG